MADIKKKGFKTIETNYEELDEQIWNHRKAILKRVLQIIAVIAVVIIGINLLSAIQSYDSYEVRDEIERKSSGSTQYQMFGDCLLEYSNDGIACINENRDIVWNQSFEMTSPKVQSCGDYMVVYDAAGTNAAPCALPAGRRAARRAQTVPG